MDKPARALLAALLLAVAGCSQGGNQSRVTVTGSPSASPSPTGGSGGPSEPTATPAPSASPTDDQGPPRVVGTVATRLAVPWGLDFLPGGDALVTERDTARVLRISGPGGRVRVVGRVGAVVPREEAGPLGLAVSPDFATDRLVYLYLSTETDNRVVRVRFDGSRLGRPEVVLSGITNGFIHDGGRLEFGPDGYLYVSTGETGQPDLAQERDSLAGKILRITPDGEPAPGNPFGTEVWSWGHRNVQGLAFDDDGRLWASEFGQDAFDELNAIERGQNYGWPEVEGNGGGAPYVDPQQVWDTDEASPSGLAFADGHLWLAALQGERLWRVAVADGRATEPTAFFVGRYGRMRTVAVAPDGMLWLTTSNRDGRGSPAPDDDRILIVDP